MEIPANCEGCPEVELILAQPVKGFGERIVEETGSNIHSTGGHPARVMSGPPDYVHLVSGKGVDGRTISQAWYGAKWDRERIEEQARDQAEGCPGMCEASVAIPGRAEATVQVCGKIALSSLDKNS